MNTEYLVSVSPRWGDSFLQEVKTTPAWRVRERLEPERFLCQGWPEEAGLFALHRFPVQMESELESFAVPQLVSRALLEALPLPDLDGAPFSIQITANQRLPWKFGELVEALVQDGKLNEMRRDTRSPQNILSLYLYQDSQACRLMAGCSAASENLSHWSGGQCRIPRDRDSVSRAEAKLLEALEAFPVKLSEGMRALDLGAAPGGWSRILAQRGLRVEAVDPADLDPRVKALAGVTHRQTTSGDFLRQKPGKFDLLVCDMKMEAAKTADFLSSVVPSLNEKAQVITTLKLKKSGASAVHEARKALAQLRKSLKVVTARQLFFNRSEITVLASRI